MENLIIAAILLVILGAAIAYIVKAKKRGVKCIGCPDSKNCSKAHAQGEQGCCGNCSSCAGCHGGNINA